MLNKLLSTYSFDFLDSSALDNAIFPLFQCFPVKSSLDLFDQHCHKIESWLILYIEGGCLLKHDSVYLSRLVKTYFKDIRDQSIFLSFQHEQLNPLLSKISLLLPTFDPQSSYSSFSSILDNFLSVIQEITCFDQHRDGLRSILLCPVLKLFDPPISKFVDFIFHRMISQINLTVSSWDHTVFKGFYDSEPIHSEHILFLILDDLFGIAGGGYKTEEDLIFLRTPLAYHICKACFEGKLTLKHLFSDGTNSWRQNVSNLLSSGLNCPESDFKLSIQDLLDSPDLLSFLLSRNLLSEKQLDLLKSCIYSNDDHVFDLGWMRYSDSSDFPETTYTNFFTDALLTYTFQKLSLTSNFMPLPDRIFTINQKNQVILDKLINCYFLGQSSPDFFSFSDITHAISSLDSDTFFRQPFLKSMLSLFTLMLAYVRPEDSLLFFNSFIWPARKQLWVVDCLRMMICSNTEAFLNLPFDKCSSIVAYNTSIFHLIAVDHPDSFTDLIIASKDLFFPMRSLKSSDGNSPFHLLARSNPSCFLNLFQHFPDLIVELTSCHDFDNLTPYHSLFFKSPVLFVDLLVAFPDHQDSLLLLFTNLIFSNSFASLSNPTTPFHILAKDYPSLFLKILNLAPLMAEKIIDCKDFNNSTPYFFLLESHPKIFIDCLRRFPDLNQIFIRSETKNSLRKFVQDKPDLFLDLLDKDSSHVFLFSNLKDFVGKTAFHYLGFHHPSHLAQFLDKNPDFFNLLSKMLDTSDVSPLMDLYKIPNSKLEALFLRIPLLATFMSEFSNCTGYTSFVHWATNEPERLLDFMLLYPHRFGLLTTSLKSHYFPPLFLLFDSHDKRTFKFINSHPEFFPFLTECRSPSNQSIFHFFAKYKPSFLLEFSSTHPSFFTQIGDLTDKLLLSPFHVLSNSHLDSFVSLIKNNSHFISLLLRMSHSVFGSPLKNLLKLEDSCLVSLLHDFPSLFFALGQDKSRAHHTCYHSMVNSRPLLFHDLLFSNPERVSFCLESINNYGTSPFSVLCLQYPNLFVSLLLSHPNIIDLFESFKDFSGSTLLHTFAKNSPGQFFQLLHINPKLLEKFVSWHDIFSRNPYHLLNYSMFEEFLSKISNAKSIDYYLS